MYATHGAQPYHTDSSDLVALLCLKPAKVGGYSTWASSYSIYNSLLQTQPELVEALVEEFYLDRKDEVPEGEGPWFKLPIFSWHKVSVANSNPVHLMCLSLKPRYNLNFGHAASPDRQLSGECAYHLMTGNFKRHCGMHAYSLAC